MDTILIVTTGGTIEAPSYPNGYKQPPVFRELSLIPGMLERCKFTHPYRVVAPFMVDSRFMNEEHRRTLLDIIVNVPEQKVIVSHGTMTLSDTHRWLKQHFSLFKEKTVILFGANIAPSDQTHSDAEINLGFAFGACRFTPPGVYLGMNGYLLKSPSCKTRGIWKEEEI